MRLHDISEGVAGPKNCWPGHRKIGTQPGTGKNAGKRVNKCKKIGEDVAEGQVTKTKTGIIHKATDKYGAGEVGFGDYGLEKTSMDLTALNKDLTSRLDKAMGIKHDHGNKKKTPEGLTDEINPADVGEYDREGDMAIGQLKTAADAANELRSILDSDENLPEWVQSKITKAVDYLDTARDYMKSKESVTEMDSEGHRGHRGDEDPGKGPEKVVKPARAKDVEKDAEEKLNKAMDQAHKKKGVAEGGPFSYGAKQPRKGSVADLAAKKRKEQDKNYKPTEPKDQMVGTAKVTKGVAEGLGDTRTDVAGTYKGWKFEIETQEEDDRYVKFYSAVSPDGKSHSLPKGTTMDQFKRFVDSKSVKEAYDPWDEGDTWYKFDSSAGLLKQRSWKHAQEREAVAAGWSQSHEQALKRVGIIRSKFNPKKFVQNVGGKWVEVFPYGKP